MKIYTVRVNGNKVRDFVSGSEAKAFSIHFLQSQALTVKSFQYLDEAVDKSDLSEANEVLKYIMEK